VKVVVSPRGQKGRRPGAGLSGEQLIFPVFKKEREDYSSTRRREESGGTRPERVGKRGVKKKKKRGGKLDC